MKISRIHLYAFLFTLLGPLAGSATEATGQGALQVIDFQLRWQHQFQFAGYYAAIEQGYYRDAGLDVRLHEGAPGRVPVDEVLAGRAQYGESNSEILRERLKGKPLVALAAIFQHSPSVLLARADSGIRTPRDLAGKKVMLVNGRYEPDFYAMFLREGVSPESMITLPLSHQISDFVSGKIDAFQSYLTNEPFRLAQRKLDYVVIDPRHYGLDYYSDILFTTERELSEHPDRVAAFRAATLRGWRYAMDHPTELINLLIDKYQVKKSRAHLEFEETTMRLFILPDIVELGHMNPRRWQNMLEAFKAVGLADRNASLEGFVYDPYPRGWDARIRNVVVLLGSIIGAILLAMLAMFIVQKRLRTEIALRKAVEEGLSHTNDVLRRTGELAKVGGWENDFANNISSWTDEAARIRDIPPGTVMSNEEAIAFYEPEARSVILQANAAAINEGIPWDHELPMVTATGRHIWVRNHGEPVVRDGKTVLLVGTIQDITERKLAELALLRRTRELEMHNSILRKIHQGASLVEMLNSMARQVETLDPDTLCSIHLLDDQGKHLRHVAAPSLPNDFNRAVDGLAIGDGVGSCGTAAFRGERVIVDNLQQHPYWEAFRDLANQAGLHSCWSQPIKNNSGRVLGTLAIYHRQPAIPRENEIALIENYAHLAELMIERRRAEEQIRNLAFYDTLTELPNRRMLYDRLSLAIAVSKRSGRYGALMFLDLDNFKVLNDTHGHAVGDLLLVQVAQRISGCVREADTVARFGGDEFVVMLGELDESKVESTTQARAVAEKIRSLVGEPYRLTGEPGEVIEHCCSASIGVALFVNHETALDDILKRADAAMYQAKEKGRDRVCFVD